MPIEIKELIVRAVVNGSSPGQGAPEDVVADHTAIVEECVRQVLRVLRRQQER